MALDEAGVKKLIEQYLAAPDPAVVNKFHSGADTDFSGGAHHSLGPGTTQAAAGSHTHDGNSSPKLWEPTAVSGSTTDDKVASLITILQAVGIVST